MTAVGVGWDRLQWKVSENIPAIRPPIGQTAENIPAIRPPIGQTVENIPATCWPSIGHFHCGGCSGYDRGGGRLDMPQMEGE
jgi:hypothetical protein